MRMEMEIIIGLKTQNMTFYLWDARIVKEFFIPVISDSRDVKRGNF